MYKAKDACFSSDCCQTDMIQSYRFTPLKHQLKCIILHSHIPVSVSGTVTREFIQGNTKPKQKCTNFNTLTKN